MRDPATSLNANSLPIAVNLDGWLVKGDLFGEAVLRFLGAHPSKAVVVVSWLIRGPAYAKERLANAAPFDAAFLPYDEGVIEWLREQRARGRRLVLTTTSDMRGARAVAEHLGLFEQVLASDGTTSLGAEQRAALLAEAFPGGFVYAVDEAPHLAARARTSARGGIWAVLTAMRPYQWAKNVLVFLPMILAHAWLDLDAWRAGLLAFVALSLAASSVYIINDSIDIDADRQHPRKRSRPLASGALSPAAGILTAVVLAAASLLVGNLAGLAVAIGVYLIVSSAYTFSLKRKPLVDVFVLASLYMMRVVLGGIATGHQASAWLLAFCGFFFFSLALAKRVLEIDAAPALDRSVNRRGYLATDSFILKAMGVGAGLVSCLVLALHLQSDFVREHYREPLLLWMLPASAMFWLCRMWLLVARGELHHDPLLFAFRDRTSWLVALTVGAAYMAALMSPPW